MIENLLYLKIVKLKMNVFRNENVFLLEYLKAESKYLYDIKRILLENFKVYN